MWSLVALIQVLLLVSTLILPAAVMAQDPDPGSSEPAATSEPTANQAADPEPEPEPQAAPEPAPDPTPKPKPDPTPAPEPTVAPDPEPTAAPAPEPEPEVTAAPDPGVEPEPIVEPDPGVEPEPIVEPDPGVEPEPIVEPDPGISEEPAPEVTAEPEPASAPVREYIVTFAPGVSAAEQLGIIDGYGLTVTDSILVLHMRVLTGTPEQAQALEADAAVIDVERDREREAEAVPSDPRYDEQWSLPLIGWQQAYTNIDPAGSAIVAVLDTGVEASHPDLAGQLVAGAGILEGSDPNSDPSGHGTAMAGIIAAATDNGTAIAGVGYDGVKVMPITVLGADETGQDSDVIEGVVWAVGHGADVILMAFANPTYSNALQIAVDYAWDNGVVVVAAAGNDGTDVVQYPAGIAGVVGVSATNANDNLTAFSNYGASVFMAAPGKDIPTLNTPVGFTTISGTSAAAAHVAAAAALIRANDPGVGPGVVVARLARNAEDIGGTSGQFGNGRLNILRALEDQDGGGVRPTGAPGTGPFVGPYVAQGADGSVAVTPGGVSTTTTSDFTFTFKSSKGSESGGQDDNLARLILTAPNFTGLTNLTVSRSNSSLPAWSVSPSTTNVGGVTCSLAAPCIVAQSPDPAGTATASATGDLRKNETLTIELTATAPASAGDSNWSANIIGRKDFNDGKTGSAKGTKVVVTGTSWTISSVTVNGGTSATVYPGTQVTVAVTATGPASADWHATGGSIGSTAPNGNLDGEDDPTVSCEDHGDHNDGGTFTEPFAVVAPATPGTYSAYVQVNADNHCKIDKAISSVFTLVDSITVIPDTTPPSPGTVNDGTGADIDTQVATDKLQANWSGFSDNLAIDHYVYGASTSSTCLARDVIADVNVGLNTSRSTNVPLQLGATYYACVQAFDVAGLSTSWVASDGVTVVSSWSITAATVNGSTSIEVLPGASVSISVTGAENAGSSKDWHSTGAAISPSLPGVANAVCFDNPDHNSGGPFTEPQTGSYLVTAPSVPGAYNASFQLWHKNDCSDLASTVFTLANGVVVKRTTETSVTSSLNPAVFGESVTFTATVTGAGAGSGNPAAGDGAVTFKSDGLPICTDVALVASGIASCTVSDLTATNGTPHAITAEYAGGSSYFLDSSGSLSGGQTVSQASSSTVISCPLSVVYDGSAQEPCSVAVTGAGGLNEAPSPVYSANTDAGTANAAYTFVGDANHTGSSDSVDFTIEQRPITITATAGQSKTVGQPDPTFAYSVTSGSLASGDSITGMLDRVAGETVGFYAITIGSLVISDGNGGANYELSFVSNDFEIESAAYAWTGFLQPVDNPGPTMPYKVNSVKAGSSVPIKFKLGGYQGLDVLYGLPGSVSMACNTLVTSGDIEEATTAGNSSLSYDASTDTYTYVWKTNKAWAAGSCREFSLKLDDGTTHIAYFTMK